MYTYTVTLKRASACDRVFFSSGVRHTGGLRVRPMIKYITLGMSPAQKMTEPAKQNRECSLTYRGVQVSAHHLPMLGDPDNWIDLCIYMYLSIYMTMCISSYIHGERDMPRAHRKPQFFATDVKSADFRCNGRCLEPLTSLAAPERS